MVEVSLTEFVDFVIKSGTPKLTQVRTIKRQHEAGYEPSRDYYRKLRDGIVAFHRQRHDKRFLDGLSVGVTDKNKRNTYPQLVSAYKRFLGRKQLDWFEPAKAQWSYGSLRVRVNPELGLSMNGEDHLVKLYFKDLKLTKERIAIVSHMMLKGLGTSAEGMKVALLDVRNSRLQVFDSLDSALEPLLEGEALSFSRMYRAI